MITTIRLHSFTNSDHAEWGDTGCDFRGDKFLGAAEGDGHKTLLEFDIDDSTPEGQELIRFVLAGGPAVNTFQQQLISKVEATGAGVLSGLGGPLGAAISTQMPNLRWGVWDKKAPH